MFYSLPWARTVTTEFAEGALGAEVACTHRVDTNAVLFDGSVRHRGRANATDRPLLLCTITLVTRMPLDEWRVFLAAFPLPAEYAFDALPTVRELMRL